VRGKRGGQAGAAPTLPDEATIKALADPKVFERGRAVLRSGAVSALVRRGEELTAAVAGSEDAPYRVAIRLKDGTVADHRCTCPYEWGGACKHVVATLLAAAVPGAVAERPTLRALLGDLPREALADLLVRRAAADPDLAGWIEVEMATVPGRGAVDPAPVAAQARTLLAHQARRGYWDDYEAHGPADALKELVGKAVPFLEAGDGRNALAILVSVAEPFVEQWLGEMAETDEEMDLLFDDLGRMMAEAVLTSDLSEEERDDLFETVEGWHAELAEYGPEGFSIVTAALAAGWDAPWLRAVLAGEAGAVPPRAERESGLVAVRLRVLAAAGRTDAYLALARAAGDEAACAEMLVRLGRIDEAVAHAVERIADPDAALALARRLHAAGHPDPALDVAQAALRRAAAPRGGPALSLARWLRDEAHARKRRDLALTAARAAFAQGLTLADYESARTVAGKTGWDPVRDDLLALLAGADRARDRIAILLEEGLVGDAMAAAEAGRDGRGDEAVLLRLAEAALDRDPAWVVDFAEARAKPLLTEGPDTYERAAAWLARAKRGYLAQGRQTAWSARIGDLAAENKRRHKLRPLLEALR
jgi:uncharacterized Zn finger protein